MTQEPTRARIGTFKKSPASPSLQAAERQKQATALLEQGRHDEAITQFTTAIEVDTKSYDAHFARGAACAKVGQNDKAIADFSKVRI